MTFVESKGPVVTIKMDQLQASLFKAFLENGVNWKQSGYANLLTSLNNAFIAADISSSRDVTLQQSAHQQAIFSEQFQRLVAYEYRLLTEALRKEQADAQSDAE